MLLLTGINWSKLLTMENINSAIRIIVLLGLGFPLLLFICTLVGKAVKKRFTPQASMLIRKGIFYFGSILLIISVLYQMGFKLTALLGAAGIAGIAIGFASQTSVSNIISGLFLISEKPFEVGDLIKVDDTKGTILSIDLLSVKLRTLDNQLVRIPNESLIKNQVTNITRFPIRRFDINIGVAYKEDVSKVRTVLLDIAQNNPYCLDEPEPLVLFLNFGDSALEFLFAVWFVKTDFFKLRNSIMQEIKERFDAEGIEIPFPHRTLYTGSVTEPFPVEIVSSKAKKPKQRS
ncbi:MAG: mechanosensitive ion channel family protein [Sedimentisphaerales bacterium]